MSETVDISLRDATGVVDAISIVRVAIVSIWQGVS